MRLRSKALPADAGEDEAESIGLLNRIVFAYVGKVIKTAKRKKGLDVEDVPRHVRLTTSQLWQRFHNALLRRQGKRNVPKKDENAVESSDDKGTEQGSLRVSDVVVALLAGRKKTIAMTALGYLISQGCQLAGPLLLNQIVQGLSCRESEPAQERALSGCDGTVTQKTLYMCALATLRLLCLQAA